MRIVVIGSSGHAKLVIAIIESLGKHDLVGLIDTYKCCGEAAFGYPILGTEEMLPAIAEKHNVDGGFVAIGDNWTRSLMACRILDLLPDFEFISLVHPSALIARGVCIGRGTAVMAATVISPDCTVGDFCIVNTKASLGHDSIMEDFSSLGPNVTTGGNVHIGDFSAISLGANLIHGLQIGQHTVIGAGALVVRDMPEFCVAYGIPAKVVRKREKNDKYL